MNKDVVYIEPEDDITDIISRLKKSHQKVVALVPPKKIGVLRSAVNTKLVAKAARSVDKVVVIVTQDPSLIKLAAAASIPVANNLQSRPKLPSEIVENSRSRSEQVINEKDFDDEDIEPEEHPVKKPQTKPTQKKTADQDIDSDDLEDKKSKKGKKGNIPNIEKYRKFIIAGAIAGVALIVFLIWAIAFAPAATIMVAVRTTGNNIAENVSFVTNKSKEDPERGIFYVEKQEKTDSNSIKFKATGEKDVGEKAKGTITVAATFNVDSEDDTLTIPAGTTFSSSNLKYTTDSAIVFGYNKSGCTDVGSRFQAVVSCKADVAMTAAAPGSEYNTGAGSVWTSSVSGVTATNAAPFIGGTSKIAKVVSQSDIDKAKQELESPSSSSAREDMIKGISDDLIVIESSFTQESSDPKSEPGLDAEAETAELTAAIKYSVYVANREAVENYIKKRAGESLASDQKVYELTNLRFENFKDENKEITAKLKAVAQTGPKVTEEDILTKSLGSKKKDVYSKLKPINGVSNVEVKTSFFWVNSIPKDEKRVTVELKIEE